MVVAQLVERLLVAQMVGGSSPLDHPMGQQSLVFLSSGLFC